MTYPDDKDVPQIVNHCTAFYYRYYILLAFDAEK